MKYKVYNFMHARFANHSILTLKNIVEAKRRANKKLHEVWELLIEGKYCNSNSFVKQKLDYMHDNPGTGKWYLCSSPVESIHSSAKYYLAS